MSHSLMGQNQFEKRFGAYESLLRGNTQFPQSLSILPSIQSLEERMSTSMGVEQAPVLAEDSEISHTRYLMDLHGAANENNQQTHGLSLSLGSSHVFVPTDQYRERSLNPDLMNPHYFMATGGHDQAREACYPGGKVTNEYSNFSSITPLNLASSDSSDSESSASVIGNSRYLKTVQSLLEEFVDVSGNVFENTEENDMVELYHEGSIGARRLSSELKAELFNNKPLSGEKHEMKLKLARLINLLDEMESRHEKYYHQLQELVSSFEMIAGVGAAKCYTALALQTMFRHFCSLREAITCQINLEKRKLMQYVPKTSSGLSQLSLFDREGRHGRLSLQNLGLTQSQSPVWRPIRGLPETSVAILRSWLFEHFLHPYPNDNEKLMLASQTGLSKNQVSNWFINARVRLWKPMIEEMYQEELGDSSEDSNASANYGNSITRKGISDQVEEGTDN